MSCEHYSCQGYLYVNIDFKFCQSAIVLDIIMNNYSFSTLATPFWRISLHWTEHIVFQKSIIQSTYSEMIKILDMK